MSELRLYTFVNFYLSQIQQGIQTAHIVSELLTDIGGTSHTTISSDDDIVVQQVSYTEEDLMVLDWAEHDKTIIVCNGGNNVALNEMIEFFDKALNPFPWTTFHEDDDSLCGALTAVGIILPEELYDAQYSHENDEYVWVGDDEEIYYRNDSYTYALLQLVKSKRLA